MYLVPEPASIPALLIYDTGVVPTRFVRSDSPAGVHPAGAQFPVRFLAAAVLAFAGPVAPVAAGPAVVHAAAVDVVGAVDPSVTKHVKSNKQFSIRTALPLRSKAGRRELGVWCK